MHPYEQARKLAGERLIEAHRALDDYVYGGQCDPESLKRLSEAVSFARREAVRILSELWPESDAPK
jgi:hypothetical protein